MTTIRPTLHHVTIKTSRMDKMIEWYGTVVGAKVQFRDQGACWMTNDEANHRVAFLTVPGLSDDRRESQPQRRPPLRFRVRKALTI